MTARKIIEAWFTALDAHPEIDFDDLASLEKLIDTEVEERKDRWIPVTERLPEPSTPRPPHHGYWVCRDWSTSGLTDRRVEWETIHPENWADESKFTGVPITYWLDWQIPELPKGGE